MKKTLAIINICLVSIFTFLALVTTPKDAVQGDAVRLLYIHVPTAWLAYLSFIVTSISCVMILIYNGKKPSAESKAKLSTWDTIALSSAQIGLLFCGLTLILGMLWGKPTWGVFWTWDARLITTVILFISYCAYLAVRSLPQGDGQGDGQGKGVEKVYAIVGIIAAINIPIVHFSVNWWRTLHQEATVFNSELKAQISGSMAFTLWFGVLIFSILYVSLMINLYSKNTLFLQRGKETLDENIELRVKEQKQEGTK